MEQPTQMDPSIVKLIASTLGALASLRFLKGLAWPEKVAMTVGGIALSYFGATPIATRVNMLDAEGLVGFLLGLFGMAIVARLYEAIQGADFKTAGADLWERFLKRMGF